MNGRPATDPAQRANPDTARAAATEKARKLERALEAMSDEEGPVVDALRAEFSRSQRRLAELDKQRAAEEELLTEARARLERLKLEAEQGRTASAKPQTGPIPTQVDGSAEVQRLQQMVVELQAKLSSVGLHQELTRDTPIQDVEHSKKRFGENYVPACVENLVQWMSDRQKDLQEAMLSGRIQDVPRLAKLVADGGAQLKAWTAENQSTVAT